MTVKHLFIKKYFHIRNKHGVILNNLTGNLHVISLETILFVAFTALYCSSILTDSTFLINYR